jgi:hypothetical protein
MPEATMDEDDCPELPKYEIGFAGQFGMKSKSQSLPMKVAADSQLRFRVLSTNA